MAWDSLYQWFSGSRLGRRLLDTVFRARARRRLAALDEQPVEGSQNRILRGLIHQAHRTRFGQEHNFHRIHTAADFRRLVPIRSPAELWRDYWQPAFPNLAGATWPGPIPYLTIREGPHPAGPPWVPVSSALLAAHRAAALTALGMIDQARPEARPLGGRLLVVSEELTHSVDELAIASRQLNNLASEAAAEVRTTPPEAMAVEETPALRPNLLPARPFNRRRTCLQSLAEQSVPLPVTTIAGPAECLLPFFDHAQRTAGAARVADVWPQLAAVLYGRGRGETDRAALANAIGHSRVLLLETCFRPEAPVAVEDVRHGLLRLLADHGVYFEFVPLAELHAPHPIRHAAAEVEVGVPYALALSSPAGYWACLADLVVRFERRDPPLFQLLDPPAPGLLR
jgi:hypothetical protein